jgi:hypothetical protein
MTELQEPAAPPPEGWEGILDPGERILWQGRPAPRPAALPARGRRNRIMPFAVIAFSIFWMVQAMQAGGVLWLFGLVFLYIGIRELRRRPEVRRDVLPETFYTLTDRRAFIATDLGGKRDLRSYPIDRDTVVELVDGRPGSVYFATAPVAGGLLGGIRSRIGFELVEDARSVYALIREIQGPT